MDTITFMLRSVFKFSITGIVVYFLSLNPLYASAKGCCSKHGGVANCNTTTGYLMCKDGTQSPSCKCSQKTTPYDQTKKTTKITKPTTTTTTPTTTNTTTNIGSATTGGTTTSKRGCCKGHGGVASCDTKSGYQRCKDGTLSPTCKCS